MRKIVFLISSLLLLHANAFAKDGGVLVFGGTGRLGAPIAKLLVQAGEDVTIFARKDSPKDRLAGLKVDYVVGDLTDDKSIAAAFNGKKYRVVIDASAQRGEQQDREILRNHHALHRRSCQTNGREVIHSSWLDWCGREH